MDNEVEFQNSAFNDWNILAVIGRMMLQLPRQSKKLQLRS